MKCTLYTADTTLCCMLIPGGLEQQSRESLVQRGFWRRKIVPPCFRTFWRAVKMMRRKASRRLPVPAGFGSEKTKLPWSSELNFAGWSQEFQEYASQKSPLFCPHS